MRKSGDVETYEYREIEFGKGCRRVEACLYSEKEGEDDDEALPLANYYKKDLNKNKNTS